MRKLKVGIIGTGFAFELLHYPAYRELWDKYEIVALCDVDRFKAEEWSRRLGLGQDRVFTNYHQLLSQPYVEVVDIMVPIEDNFEVMEAAAAAGKAVISEKPLAPTWEQARKARELPYRYGVPIMIAEQYRYNEEINIIRDMVRLGGIGEVVYFMQNRTDFLPGKMLGPSFHSREWRQHPDYPGGALLDVALHEVAGLRHIFGAIDKVHAFARRQNAQFGPYAAVNVNMLFMNGVTGQFTFYGAGQEPQHPLVGLRIFGTKGMIYLEDRDCGVINVFYNSGAHEQVPYRPQRGYYNELLNFYNAAIGLEPISVPPEMEFGDTKTIFDIIRSIEEGRVVDVDRVADYNPNYSQPEAAHRAWEHHMARHQGIELSPPVYTQPGHLIPSYNEIELHPMSRPYQEVGREIELHPFTHWEFR